MIYTCVALILTYPVAIWDFNIDTTYIDYANRLLQRQHVTSLFTSPDYACIVPTSVCVLNEEI